MNGDEDFSDDSGSGLLRRQWFTSVVLSCTVFVFFGLLLIRALVVHVCAPVVFEGNGKSLEYVHVDVRTRVLVLVCK